MSQFFISSAVAPAPPGTLTQLTPDFGGAVAAVANNINVTGVTTTDTNFETFNGGAGVLQIAHRYQGTVTTSDGAGQTQTILTIPVTVSTALTITAMVAAIEATSSST